MKVKITRHTQVYWWAWFAFRILVWFKSPGCEHKVLQMELPWFLKSVRNPYIKTVYGLAFYHKGSGIIIMRNKYSWLGDGNEG